MNRLFHLGFSSLFFALIVMSLFAVGYVLIGMTATVLAEDGRLAGITPKPAEVNVIEAEPSKDSRVEDTAKPKPIIEESQSNSLRQSINNNSGKSSFDAIKGAVTPLDFRATAYCLKGRTASGVHTRPGIVAADPRVLPLGTVVHIEAGRYTGTYTVLDTGRRIKGRAIDIYISDYREAKRFGNRRIKVRVLGKRQTNAIRSARQPFPVASSY
jgi:3D (Asp-Asp-Asp) domain-containing protein